MSSEITLASITERIKAKVGENCGLNATLKFILDDDEFIHIDALKIPNDVTNSDLPSECSIKISKKNVIKLMDGEMNAYTAFMMGKVKVEGNMAVAMNLNKIL